MNAQQLQTPDGKPVRLWMCSKCRFYNPDQSQAEQCCQCLVCHVETRGYGTCSTCIAAKWKAEETRRTQELLAKAERISIEDYEGQLYSDANNKYYNNLEAYLDDCACDDREPAEYLWACTSRPLVDLNAQDHLDSITERIAEDAWDEFDCDGINGQDDLLYALQVAFQKFGEANKESLVWDVDHGRIVIISQKPLNKSNNT